MSVSQASPQLESTASPPGTPEPIVLRDVHKHFGDVRAVDGVDLTVGDGEVVAFLGPNGAGKTTTLDMILALSAPTSGSVQVFGQTPRRAVDLGWVTAVTQTGGLIPELSVWQHVRVMADLFGYSAERANEVMGLAKLEPLAKRKIKVCSGGERQRVKFAMALVSRPKLLILDEPTTGMDVNARRDFWAGVHDAASRGTTVMFATHYLEEADEFADRVVIVVGGKVVADGPTGEIRNLVAGRTVTCEFPNPQTARAAAGLVKDLTDSVNVQGQQLIIHSHDSDTVLERLVTQGAGARNILVLGQSIEDVFVALTEGDQR
ncbi:MAG: ABC transporter ATP-binding protein [Bifidobacteriaceae bacterium]|jgi:ABC-2 type transport system ATP-binding protein|nr:ABC transporter ATP-binding protein [Bifidobacteriaceae bacterium]